MYVPSAMQGGKGVHVGSAVNMSHLLLSLVSEMCLQFVKELDLDNYIDDVEVRASLEAVSCVRTPRRLR
jgi:hypothetical protein